jgi:hypothetical protein
MKDFEFNLRRQKNLSADNSLIITEKNVRDIYGEIKDSKNLSALILQNEKIEKSFKSMQNSQNAKKITEVENINKLNSFTRNLYDKNNLTGNLQPKLTTNINLNMRKHFNVINSEFSNYFDQNFSLKNQYPNFFMKKNEINIIKNSIMDSFSKNIKSITFSKMIQNDNEMYKNKSTSLLKNFSKREGDKKFVTNLIGQKDIYNMKKPDSVSKIFSKENIIKVTERKYELNEYDNSLKNLKPIRIKKFRKDNTSIILNRIQGNKIKNTHFFADVNKYIKDARLNNKQMKNAEAKTNIREALKMTNLLIDEYNNMKLSKFIKHKNNDIRKGEEHSVLSQEVGKNIFTPNNYYNMCKINIRPESLVKKPNNLMHIFKKTNSNYYLNLSRNTLDLKLGKFNYY